VVDVFRFPDATYRRRIELRPEPGLIDAEMEDYCHHFRVRLAHRDGVVVGAEGEGVRYPWDTCPVGAGAVTSLVGTSLAAAVDASRWAADRSGHCVHVVDLTLLAVRHALDSAGTTYEAVVTPGAQRRREATLSRNGGAAMAWSLLGEEVIAPEGYAGLRLAREPFFAWVRARLSAEEQEAAVILRRACYIGVSRGLDLDVYRFAADAHPADESCHTYRADVAARARRMIGSSRATEDDAGPLSGARRTVTLAGTSRHRGGASMSDQTAGRASAKAAVSPLDDAKRRRKGVQASLVELERALAAPSTGREQAWASRTGVQLAELRVAWQHHVETTEAPGGLFEEIVSQAPRLSHQVEHLRSDHVQLAEAIAGAERAAKANDAADRIDEVAEAALELLAPLTRHRQLGSTLVYEAYSVDIDAAD
jgi:hypothetical protein